MSTEQTNHFRPAPGFVLARPLKKEEQQQSTLSMPGSAKDKTDSVGVAEVIECGAIRTIDGQVEFEYKLEPGDIIAYMPFTDVLIDAGSFEKNCLVGYTSIRAIKKASEA